MKNKSCILYLVRHGETEWNVKRLIQGHKDIPLNEKGKQQAIKLARQLRNIRFDAIYSSDLKRTSETAELIGIERNLKIITSKSLRERDFGSFAGRSFGKEKNIMKLINNLKLALESETRGIENDKNLMERFVGFMEKISKENFGKTILVVSHAGPMRTFLIRLGWGTYENLTEGCISNLAYVKLQSTGKEFMVKKTYGITKIE